MGARVCVTRRWKTTRDRALGRAPTPPTASVSGPLLSGTVYLANLAFTGAGAPATVAAADSAVVRAYLGHVLPPISAYASQYGPNSLALGPPLPLRTVATVGGEYSDADLQRWVNALVIAERLGPGAAILVLNPPGLVNRDAKESGGVGVLGYHGLATVPYSFVNLLGSGFALGDPTDLYAEAVSHEIAEMTVDPRADGSNPEVCDGCGTNCQGAAAFRAYFSLAGLYLGSGNQFPPSSPYGVFLSAIARPVAASACPAPASACAYPPPGK